MAFIVGAVIGGVAAIAGGAIASKGAKRGGEIAAAGGDREIEFNRESRDLARADQAPYREAGTTALNALMSLTGLGGGGGATKPVSSPNSTTGVGRFTSNEGPLMASRRFRSSYVRQRATGGPTGQGQMYNINELGPENVYSGGALSRNPNPMTIDGQTGYVEPNIQGRAYGGAMRDPRMDVMGDQPIWRGAPPPRVTGPPKGPTAPTGDPNNNWGAVKNWGGNANTTAINPQTGFPNENPGGVEGGYNFMTEPGYQFRFEEGQRALDRGAAARGGLLSGGYGRKAIRYGQGFASNEFSNVYNRISNIAGLGQTAATTSGNAALYGGANMGNAASNAANASAYGAVQSGNAWANAGNQIAQLPWGNIFKPGQTQPTTNTWNPYTDNASQGWRNP